MSKPLTAVKIKEYFAAEYSAEKNAYFSQGGAIQGEWHGKLTDVLGLTKAVDQLAFNRLAEGQHPVTAEQLIKHKDTIKSQTGEELGHRAGWDLTFSAPKSISLTALVGDDQRVREAHRRAVKVALDATEAYVQARMSATGPPENTGKWIAAQFEHDTSRPVDGYPAPQLHTHVIVFNMTEDATGGAHSLQPYELFRIQSMATAIYQNSLEQDLRNFGYEIERGKNHAPEIKGYTPEYIESESQRSALIRKALADKGFTGAEAASIAAHAGREAKLSLSPAELKAFHQEHAAAFGDQPAQVVATTAHHIHRQTPVDRVLARAEAAVAFARDRLAERSQVLEHFELLRDALRHVQGRASLRDVERSISAGQAEGELIETHHVRQHAPAHRYTTPEALAAERETIERVRASRGTLAPVDGIHSATIASRFRTLNDDQRQLILSALTSKDQIIGIQGKAGTGKTTALAAIRELAEEHGYEALGVGPTSKAVKGLKEAGMNAETMARYLMRDQSTGRILQPRLFFVDEASLASTKNIQNFLRTVTARDRVLLIGDTGQHQSVEAGRIFDQLQTAGMFTATLSKIVRQKDEGLRQAVDHFAHRRTKEGLDLLDQQGRIHETPHRGKRFQAIAAAYAAAPDGTLVVSPDNESRKELNGIIRTAMRQARHLGEDRYTTSVLVNRQQLTSADKGRASSYQAGDSVRYLRGNERLGLKAKSYATVLSSNPDTNMLTIKRQDGKVLSYDPERLRGVALYSPERRSLAIGERIQFTSPWKAQSVANRDLATVTYLDPAGNIRAQLDDTGRTVGWNLRDYSHVDYSYTMTSHSTQAVTVDRVLIHVDTSDTKARALIDQTLAYVAGSRPRYDAQIFTDSSEDLRQALSRKRENTTALSREQTEEAFAVSA